MTAFIEKLARAMYDADRELHDMRLEAHTWETDEKRQPAYRALIRAVLQAARPELPAEPVTFGNLARRQNMIDRAKIINEWLDQALSETPIDAGRG